MAQIIITPIRYIKGEICIPPDKSISHRAVMLGAIAEGVTRVKDFLQAEDCMRTIEAFRQMGIKIQAEYRVQSTEYREKMCCLKIYGKGLYRLKKPKKPIYCGNSGTTMRFLSGILAGQDFETVLTGDESLSHRPMGRIVQPLRMMGAVINEECGVQNAKLKKDFYPPLKIRGGNLKAIDYTLPVASAQVKSCILLAGLYADGVTSVIEPMPSRNHTERMLQQFGVKINKKGNRVSVKGGQSLKATDITVPADISSAAFFIVAALIVKDSKLTIKLVGTNPTRTGILDILKKMGARIRWTIDDGRGAKFEPIADLIIESSQLKATTIKGAVIPRAIDELPVIMVAATQAEGTTKILGAKELRVKETDRIKSMSEGLNKMGADIRLYGNDICIKGPTALKGAVVNSFSDHRTAMSFAIAGLVADGQTIIEDTECILTSFPNFEEILSDISQ